MATSEKNELGYFGNIWVRQHYLAQKGDTNDNGHVHFFDHVTMLVRGSVRVDVTNTHTKETRSKEFTGPTFIVVRKDYTHKFTALTDDVLYYCVFALRDIDGDVTDIYSGNNDPYAIPMLNDQPDDEYWVRKKQEQDKLDKLDKLTTSYEKD